MSKRTIGIGLIVLGVIFAIVSLAADAVGLGHAPGLGWEQLTWACVGVIVALIGALVLKG
jgi:Mg2+ and Co2+ transporter CorA